MEKRMPAACSATPERQAHVAVLFISCVENAAGTIQVVAAIMSSVTCGGTAAQASARNGHVGNPRYAMAGICGGAAARRPGVICRLTEESGYISRRRQAVARSWEVSAASARVQRFARANR